MVILFIRVIILYVLVIFALRIMGKRQVGELQPSELVIAIIISDLATIPMESKDIPLISGLIPIFTLIILEVLFSLISLKSIRFRGLISGNPSVIISKGKVIEAELENLRFSIDDLLEELRVNKQNNIAEIECAVLETNGQISIFTKNDLGLNSNSNASVKHIIVSDGRVISENLQRINRDEIWLNKKLKENKAKSKKDVFIFMSDMYDNIFCQLKVPKK